MSQKRRSLNDSEERDVALSYLCGVGFGYITNRWEISRSTAYDNIVRGRSYGWRDALVEFYRKTPAEKRMNNAAHLFLRYHGIEVPHAELVDTGRCVNVYRAVDEDVFLSITSELAGNVGFLNEFMRPSSGYERLAWDVLGLDIKGIFSCADAEMIESAVLNALQSAYERGDINHNAIYENAERAVIATIKQQIGESLETGKDIIDFAMESLTPRERRVVMLRCGLLGEGARKFREMKKGLYEDGREVSHTLVHQNYQAALGKIRRRLTRSPILLLATEYQPEVPESLRQPAEAESARTMRTLLDTGNRDVNDFEMSARARNCLEAMGVHTIHELVQKTEPELLLQKNLGHKTLNEIKEILKSAGLQLGMKLYSEPMK